MSKKIEEYLSSVGLNFPENEKELSAFNQTNEEYDYLLNEDLIDPVKILDEIKNENKYRKLTKGQSFFRRVVLAAKIVNEYYNETRFGNIKLQKMIFLCEHVSKMDFETNYFKKAAGPYDNRLMYSIRTEFEKQGWFKFEKLDGGTRVKYSPLDKIDTHKKYYGGYFSDANSEIDFLINIFRKELTKDVELVATIFFCWVEINKENRIFSNQLIIQKVYSFHVEKKKFSEAEILNKVEWMKDKGIYPKR